MKVACGPSRQHPWRDGPATVVADGGLLSVRALPHPPAATPPPPLLDAAIDVADAG